MKLSIYSLIISLLFISTIFSQEAPLNQRTEKKLSEADSIREVIFRKILPNIESSDYDYYFSVDGRKNPSDLLMRRFTDYQNKYKVKIKKISECYISSAEGDAVFDKSTNKRGVIFEISELEWKSKDEVEASAGSYLGNMGSDSCKYKLKKEQGVWKIVSEENCVVS